MLSLCLAARHFFCHPRKILDFFCMNDLQQEVIRQNEVFIASARHFPAKAEIVRLLTL